MTQQPLITSYRMSPPESSSAATPSSTPAAVLVVVGLFCLYLAWLLPRARRILAMNMIALPAPGSWVLGNLTDFKNLRRIPYSGKPDTQLLFSELAAKARSDGHGAFRISMFRFVPFLSREWIIVADYELAKVLILCPPPPSWGLSLAAIPLLFLRFLLLVLLRPLPVSLGATPARRNS